jgi:asparagine N-glycosylation enzyme membrane subunit Stt3
MAKTRSRKDQAKGPAFYAQPRFLTSPALRDWWTLLHPPYTTWHLSYVVIGACLLGPVNAVRLVATLVAFALAVGVGAHALDELHGRPLGTSIPARQLVAAATIGIGGAVALGVVGMVKVGPLLAVFIAIGVTLAVGYNLELFHGRLHTDALFALGWGSFPLLTAYYAQHANLSLAAVLAAVFAALLSQAQRQLSTPARELRRKTETVEGVIVRADGTSVAIDRDSMLSPFEATLRSLCWAVVVLALTLAALRLHPW